MENKLSWAGGWVVGLTENKANSALRLSLSLSLAWTELDKSEGHDQLSCLFCLFYHSWEPQAELARGGKHYVQHFWEG